MWPQRCYSLNSSVIGLEQAGYSVLLVLGPAYMTVLGKQSFPDPYSDREAVFNGALTSTAAAKPLFAAAIGRLIHA